MNRKAFVLPVVLVCGLLAVSLVVTFQLISGSDYKQVARIVRSAQAAAIADIASDEIAATLNALSWGPGTGPGPAKPAWVDTLLSDLQGAKARPTIPNARGIGVSKSDCPVAVAQAGKTNGLVKLDDVKGKAGPFQVLAGGNVDDAFVYKEELFQDAGKDLLAWDLRGPLNLEISISVDGPLAFSKTYGRGQELYITDTTPPGREFALMAYLPPPSADYAAGDLQKGGTWNINPGFGAGGTEGRIMLRGPLLVVPEDVPPLPNFPDKLYMGGTDPVLQTSDQSQSYPDAKFVFAMSTIPGPRELQHTDNDSNAAASVDAVVDAALDNAIQFKTDTRRPEGERSKSTLITATKSFSITVDTGIALHPHHTVDVNVPNKTYNLGEISAVLVKDPGTPSAKYDSIDEQPIGYYPPQAWYHGLIPEKKQNFRLKNTMPSSTPGTTYKGIKVSNGTSSQYTGPGGLQEGDFVTTEPAPRGGSPEDNVGLVGLVGVAIHESKTYIKVGVVMVARWIVQQVIDRISDDAIYPFGPSKREIAQNNKDSIVQQAMTAYNLDPTLKFMVRRYAVDGDAALSPPVSLNASSLKSKLSSKKAAIAPYGSFFHDVKFWNSAKADDVKQLVRDGLEVPEINVPDSPPTQGDDLLKKLLTENGNPDLASVDSGWPVAGLPTGNTKAKQVREWLVDKYPFKEMFRHTAAAGQTNAGAAFDALTAKMNKPRGFGEPKAESKVRPQGAFGPHTGTGTPPGDFPDKGELAGLFTRGTLPPKFRDWESMATRTYETVGDWIAAEGPATSLELRGAVLIKTCKSSTSIKYKGRGLVIVMSTQGNLAELTGSITKADASDTKSWLTLVHRVDKSLVNGVSLPALTLGQAFEGTVVSETGVKASGTLEMSGSLITGLINKGAGQESDVLNLLYKQDTQTALKDVWTLEASGEASSIDPPPGP